MNETTKKVALVTGASSGIGKATAKALQTAGYRVFGTSRRVIADISDGITMLSCDVTDDASVTSVVAKILEQAGRVDLVVNNAGVGLLGGAEESSITQAQALFDVNVFGVLRVTNAVLPTMRLQKGGADRQRKLGTGVHPRALLRSLCIHQACGRRLFRVT